MHVKYNTDNYRRLFKSLVQRYVQTNKVKAIEPRVRELCELIYQSGMGVAVWSCEGHCCESGNPYQGYIRLSPKNREDAARLTELFQDCTDWVSRDLSWNHTPNIECSLARYDSEVSYPSLTVRSPCFDNILDADLMWLSFTGRFKELVTPYILANPKLNEPTI